MGMTVKTKEEWFCDICKGPACPADQHISIEVYPGDGRDVGAGYLHGSLYVDIPYSVSRGVSCKACKIKFLKSYLAHLENVERD